MGPWPVTPGLLYTNIPVTGGFPSQRASDAEMYPFDDVTMEYTHKFLNTSRTIPFAHNLLLTCQAIYYISQRCSVKILKTISSMKLVLWLIMDFIGKRNLVDLVRFEFELSIGWIPHIVIGPWF